MVEPKPSRSGRHWWPSLTLALFGFLTGGSLMGAHCYQLGRLQQATFPDKLKLAAYAHESGGSYDVAVPIAVAWLVVWTIYMVRQRRDRASLILGAAALATVALGAWSAGKTAWSCNPF